MDVSRRPRGMYWGEGCDHHRLLARPSSFTAFLPPPKYVHCSRDESAPAKGRTHSLMHSQAIFHLVPLNPRARDTLVHPDNERFVSLSRARPSPNGSEATENSVPELGLEIGYHVPATPRPGVITEVGRNANLILSAPSVSAVQFAFESHPEAKIILFHDRSRGGNTTIDPGFKRGDGIRQRVLEPSTVYRITTGGETGDLYSFELRWAEGDALQKVERGYQIAIARATERARDLRWAPTPVWSSFNTRLDTPAAALVQRTAKVKLLGMGTFGKAWEAIDLDSGLYVAVKEIDLRRGDSAQRDFQNHAWREVKNFSGVSHKNIIEYRGSDCDKETLYIYMSLKEGNVNDLVKRFPLVRSDEDTLTKLLQQMLAALDYLTSRQLCHRDVKPANILYTIKGGNCIFQLADFGLSNHHTLAHTICGTEMFMAPEIRPGQDKQTSKVDVWSLFVTVMSVMGTAGLDSTRWRPYEEILDRVRTASSQHPNLSPMAREDPNFRASAAQMLVQVFDGHGLTTLRKDILPMPHSE